MGLMDKLKFWKKEEEMPEYPKAPEMGMADQQMPAGMEHMGMPRPMPGITEPPMESASFQPQAFQPQAFGQQQAMSTDQQLQLISSKLDTIKAQLETVLQRLERLERKDESPYQQRWKTSY